MELNPPLTLSELADHAQTVLKRRLERVGAGHLDRSVILSGDPDTMIRSVCPVEQAEPGALVFATSQSYLDRIEPSDAAAVVLPPNLESQNKPCLKFSEPRWLFSIILELTRGNVLPEPALFGNVRFKDRERARLGEDVVIGDWSYVGTDVKIGRGTRIFPGVFIDDRVEIGEDCLIYSGVRILRDTVIGRGGIIHPGAVIGGDGFSYDQVPDPEGRRLWHMKNHHAGGVAIGDNVEIGCQTCVDRGFIQTTVIEDGVKIDNLVQIAHNVRIGRDSIVLSQAGLAGRAVLGRQVFVLGQVGVVDGVNIGDEAILIGMAGVTSDIPAGRTAWAGRPVHRADMEWKTKALARRELPRLREFWRVFKKAGTFEELKKAFFSRPGKDGEQ